MFFRRKRLFEHIVSWVLVIAMWLLHIVDVYPVPGGVLLCLLADRKGQEMKFWFLPCAGILQSWFFCCENSNAIRYNKVMNWTQQVRRWWQITIKTENLEIILHKLIPEVIMVTPQDLFG